MIKHLPASTRGPQQCYTKEGWSEEGVPQPTQPQPAGRGCPDSPPQTHHITLPLALCMGGVLTMVCPRGIGDVTGAPQRDFCYLKHFTLLEESQGSGKFLKCGAAPV